MQLSCACPNSYAICGQVKGKEGDVKGSRSFIWKTEWQMWEPVTMSSVNGQLEEEKRKTHMSLQPKETQSRGGGRKRNLRIL